MIKHILIMLLLLNFITQGLEAQTFSNNSNVNSSVIVSNDAMQIGKSAYLSINYFKALGLMDTSFIKEDALHKKNNEKPLFLVSFKF